MNLILSWKVCSKDWFIWLWKTITGFYSLASQTEWWVTVYSIPGTWLGWARKTDRCILSNVCAGTEVPADLEVPAVTCRGLLKCKCWPWPCKLAASSSLLCTLLLTKHTKFGWQTGCVCICVYVCVHVYVCVCLFMGNKRSNAVKNKCLVTAVKRLVFLVSYLICFVMSMGKICKQVCLNYRWMHYWFLILNFQSYVFRWSVTENSLLLMQ